MQYVITILAIIGAWLNIRKRVEGFMIWTVTNSYWLIHNLRIEEYAQAFLFGVFTYLAISGWRNWKKSKWNYQ